MMYYTSLINILYVLNIEKVLTDNNNITMQSMIMKFYHKNNFNLKNTSYINKYYIV